MNHRLVALAALGMMVFATFIARAFRQPAPDAPVANVDPNPPPDVSTYPPGPDGAVTPAMPPRPAEIDSLAPTHQAPLGLEKPGIDLRRAQPRHSPFREFSPIDEIDRAVSLSSEQRPTVEAILAERETRMTAAYSDAILERQDTEAGTADVTSICMEFDEQIRRSLTSDQQARFDAARAEGRIGAPMFVFRYGQ